MPQEQDKTVTAPPHPGDANAPVVALRGIALTFENAITALSGIDLDVAPGEFLTVIGASGSGKSTLLRIMACLETPTSGTLTRIPEIARPGGTAMVFQDPALMPWASVFDNVWLPIRIAGMSHRDAAPRIDAALETVGLADRADALPRELSGGMRMRVSIARALVTEPRLILLDEPFAALDEMTRFRLNDVMHGLWARKKLTFVLVTHSISEAAYLSTRIAVLSRPPGGIAAEMQIPADIARNQAFRESAGYLDCTRRLSALLEQAG